MLWEETALHPVSMPVTASVLLSDSFSHVQRWEGWKNDCREMREVGSQLEAKRIGEEKEEEASERRGGKVTDVWKGSCEQHLWVTVQSIVRAERERERGQMIPNTLWLARTCKRAVVTIRPFAAAGWEVSKGNISYYRLHYESLDLCLISLYVIWGQGKCGELGTAICWHMCKPTWKYSM